MPHCFLSQRAVITQFCGTCRPAHWARDARKIATLRSGMVACQIDANSRAAS
jgi:hypothetical protein